jgi:hypothetical protein
MRLASPVDEGSVASAAAEVLSLCRAVRDGQSMLRLSESHLAELLEYTAGAERAASSPLPTP